MIVNRTDARALKKMGMPLATPIETREMSPEVMQFTTSLIDAYFGSEAALARYVKTSSLRAWRSVKHKLALIDSIVLRADIYVGKNGSADQSCDVLAVFVVERIAPFIRYWEGAIAAVEDGATLNIKPGDIPKVIDE